MRLAFVADIHGNLLALEAVRHDLQQQSPDMVYLVGDQVNRCPWNNEVMQLVSELAWPAIAGNHDLIVAAINTPQNRAPFTDRNRFPTLWWTQAQLAEHYLNEMRQWPLERVITYDGLPSIRLLHGIPGNAFVGILPEDTDAKIRQVLTGVEESVVVCGHVHRPLARQVDQWQVFNGGSVGIPYNSDPRAQYLLLDAVARQWVPTFRRIDYDHSPIPQAFITSGLQEVAGPIAELHLRAVMSGEPWTSDFGYWLRFQSAEITQDMPHAVELYLQQHGPNHWAFDLRDPDGTLLIE
ncbi:MAG: metallophosphoesterase family protein [Caldilineaceae bacterium]|nr:metallophosphoesterase family protein [Caldilineaceae bacterium]